MTRDQGDAMNIRCEGGACISVDQYGDAIRVRSGETGTVMQCTRDEWFAFLFDLANGKWAHIAADQAVAS